MLDGENETLLELGRKDSPFPLRVVSQERAGPGPARNLGAKFANGGLIVILNDDTRPDPGCLVAHMGAQEELGPCVAVGRVEWDPEREVTPYMEWLAPEGHQFNYARLDPAQPVPWDACWGTNLAIPRALDVGRAVRSASPEPALKDGEWGYRLDADRGVRLRYVPEAVCYHDHRYDGPADYRQRARSAGAASRYVVRRHPELAWALIGRSDGRCCRSFRQSGVARFVAPGAALGPGFPDELRARDPAAPPERTPAIEVSAHPECMRSVCSRARARARARAHARFSGAATAVRDGGRNQLSATVFRGSDQFRGMVISVSFSPASGEGHERNGDDHVQTPPSDRCRSQKVAEAALCRGRRSLSLTQAASRSWLTSLNSG